jgi:hypothetical protein
MRATFIICSFFFFSICFAQNSLNILGKWYTCGWIDDLEKIKAQTFVRKELQSDSCRKNDCSVTKWEFRKDTFHYFSQSACEDNSLGIATIRDPLSWSIDDNFKKITLITEAKKAIIFDILILTETTLKIQYSIIL